MTDAQGDVPPAVHFSKTYIHKLNYMVNSVDVPLFVSLVVGTILTIADSFDRGSLSPVVVAPVILSSFLVFNHLVFGRGGKNVMTQKGQDWNITALRILVCSPYVFIFVVMYIIGDRSELAIGASLGVSQTWLGILGARNFHEAVVFLGLHFVIILPLDIPEYWSELTRVVAIDIFLVTGAWVKGQLIYIVEQVTFSQGEMARSLECTKQSVDKLQKTLRESEQDKAHVSDELTKAKADTTLRTKVLAETTVQLRASEKRYEEMSSVAKAAVSVVSLGRKRHDE